MNSIEKGDFIITNYSNFPSLIVAKLENSYLITIHEYNGDYKIIHNNDTIQYIILSVYEKLCIISRYGDWFYNEHKNIFQELIIEGINV